MQNITAIRLLQIRNGAKFITAREFWTVNAMETFIDVAGQVCKRGQMLVVSDGDISRLVQVWDSNHKMKAGELDDLQWMSQVVAVVDYTTYGKIRDSEERALEALVMSEVNDKIKILSDTLGDEAIDHVSSSLSISVE